jgi:hypothetical protein
MLTRTPTQEALLPFTRLVLLISAVVQTVFGLVMLFLYDLFNRAFWTHPLPVFSSVNAHYVGIIYLGTAIAAAFALYQNTWTGARVYFAFAFPYIVMAVILTIVTAATNGVPAIMWAYVLLSVIYLPLVAYVWIRQSDAR